MFFKTSGDSTVWPRLRSPIPIFQPVSFPVLRFLMFLTHGDMETNWEECSK